MNCMEETELVIEYLEQNLQAPDEKVIAKITGIPNGLYQRFFTYMCGVSMKEYVRKRRLTMAAKELLTRNQNVLDVALSYGYDSHAAFTRAIKEQFQVPPIALTEEIFQRNAYSKYTFHELETYYVLKGRKIMAELVKIEYEENEECLMIGVSSKEKHAKGRALWDVYFQGYDKKLYDLREHQMSGMDQCIGIGLLGEFEEGNEEDPSKLYVVGKYFQPGTPVPDGMIGVVVPKGTIVKAQVKGKCFEDIINNGHILIQDMVARNGYQLDYRSFYVSEVYTIKDFCEPSEKGAEYIALDYYMPCVKVGK